ncbi:hypothetical protein Tco_0745277 [Tanacetum coccineum]
MIPLWLQLTFVAFLLPISILSLPECNFPAIFNFGDSNSDTGTLAAIYGQLAVPYGETYFHHSAGRYSDGRLVIDFIGIYNTYIRDAARKIKDKDPLMFK